MLHEHLIYVVIVPLDQCNPVRPSALCYDTLCYAVPVTGLDTMQHQSSIAWSSTPPRVLPFALPASLLWPLNATAPTRSSTTSVLSLGTQNNCTTAMTATPVRLNHAAALPPATYTIPSKGGATVLAAHIRAMQAPLTVPRTSGEGVAFLISISKHGGMMMLI